MTWYSVQYDVDLEAGTPEEAAKMAKAHLRTGKHTFNVKLLDANGNLAGTPETESTVLI